MVSIINTISSGIMTPILKCGQSAQNAAIHVLTRVSNVFNRSLNLSSVAPLVGILSGAITFQFMSESRGTFESLYIASLNCAMGGLLSQLWISTVGRASQSNNLLQELEQASALILEAGTIIAQGLHQPSAISHQPAPAHIEQAQAIVGQNGIPGLQNLHLHVPDQFEQENGQMQQEMVPQNQLQEDPILQIEQEMIDQIVIHRVRQLITRFTAG
jgi:hypothetical protein